MNGRRAIIFDLEGTLLDCNMHYLEAYLDAFQAHDMDAPRDEVWSMYGMRSEDIVKTIVSKYRPDASWNDVWLLMRRLFEERIKGGGLWIDGSLDVINDLGCRYLLGLGTGTSRHIIDLMLSSDEQAMFNAIVTFNDVKRGKPDPETFLLCAQKLGVEPEECLVVGDTYLDIRAAKAAEMYAIGVTTGPSTEKELIDDGADRIIGSLQELTLFL